MAYRYDLVFRLEPTHRYADLARGLAAEVADPVWFLGRQWQLGEHHGEDAASPVRVEYQAGEVPIRPDRPNPHQDPRVVPAEAIIESEPDDFWTVSRRITVGRAVEQAARDDGQPLALDAKYRLRNLPVPYDLLDDTGFDGRLLFRDRSPLGLQDAWFPEQPPRPAPVDLWNSAELAYDADFHADPATLTVRRHDGGHLDWWSVDASAPVPEPAPLPAPSTVLATRVQYPGAPHPRWWQIEEARTDLGAYGPDRSHFATLLLLELVSSHSDDWFTFPIPAAAGHLLTLHRVSVIDAFDERWTLEPPTDGWTLFTVTGLDARSLVLWPAVPTALAGPVIDQVDFGVDEDADVVWAVERRIAGRDQPAVAPPAADQPPADPAVPRYVYRAGREVPPHWHPYVQQAAERLLIQGRLADLTTRQARPMPLPRTDLLRPSPRHPEPNGIHRIDPAAVPVDGVQLERRHMLGRGTDGLPVLWQQRRRGPLAAAPTMRLRFDVLDEQ